MSYVLQGPTIREEQWILRGVEITSPQDRSKNTSSYHSIRIGLRLEGNTDWVGTWNQSQGQLSAGTALEILDTNQRNRRLHKGQAAVVEITKIGSPTSLVGASVTFHFERVGDNRGKIKPFMSSMASLDPAMRSVVDTLNASGITTFSHSVPLVDETPTAADLVSVAKYEDDQSGSDTTTAAAFEDGPVSITVSAPAGKTTYVSVYAHCTHSSNSGRNVLAVGIGDGTTDHGEGQSSAGAAGGNEGFVSARYDGTITTDTTFTLRFYRAAGSGTSTTTHHTITATAISV